MSARPGSAPDARGGLDSAGLDSAGLERALLRMLPAEPPSGTGSPAERAAEAGRWEVWQQIAGLLGVRLPHVLPYDEEPVPYSLPRRAASVARLQRLLARQRGAS